MRKKIKAKIESHSTKYMTQILDLKKYQGCKGKKKNHRLLWRRLKKLIDEQQGIAWLES